MKTKEQTSCNRCGTCCIKGGPALHGPDLELLQAGKLRLADLITIRRGEYASIPPSEELRPLQQEFIKIKGTGREWTCFFYDAPHKGCGIYDGRPLSCAVLKCWQPAESLALVEKDLLCRTELLSKDNPVLALLAEHDVACPVPDLSQLSYDIQNKNTALICELEELMNLDLKYRQLAMSRYGIELAEEMFYFGRPLFEVLASLGYKVSEAGGRVCLNF